MLRKLIMLALTTGLAKKAYDSYKQSQTQTPFPTSSRPPEGQAKQRSRRAKATA